MTDDHHGPLQQLVTIDEMLILAARKIANAQVLRDDRDIERDVVLAQSALDVVLAMVGRYAEYDALGNRLPRHLRT